MSTIISGILEKTIEMLSWIFFPFAIGANGNAKIIFIVVSIQLKYSNDSSFYTTILLPGNKYYSQYCLS